MVSAQDHLYLAAPVLNRYWGWDLASEVTPLKTYLDAGLLVAGGTDSPVIPFNPFWELYHFASRDTISDGVYGEDQKVASRTQLLKLVTINYAVMIGEEDHRGSIEPGKLADFAVLKSTSDRRGWQGGLSRPQLSWQRLGARRRRGLRASYRPSFNLKRCNFPVAVLGRLS
jgi:predicted amidohydrolase YtcJ